MTDGKEVVILDGGTVLKKLDELSRRVESLLSPAEPRQLPLPKWRAAFGIERSMAYSLVHTPGFPAYKVGGIWLIDVAEYRAWQREQNEAARKPLYEGRKAK